MNEEPAHLPKLRQRTCAVCRRSIAEDDPVLNIRGMSVHVRCAAYRRRRMRR